jgi:hypothetical protein
MDNPSSTPSTNGKQSKPAGAPSDRKIDRWLTEDIVSPALRRAAELAAKRRAIFGDANAPTPPRD